MFCVVIFVTFIAAIRSQTCNVPVIIHTETGDDLCRILLKDVADAELASAKISMDAQSTGGCTQFQNIDFFTQLLITITTDIMWLEKLNNNQITPSGDECVAVNLRMDFDVRAIQAKVNVPVPSAVCPPTSGAALAQYTLQKLGRALSALPAGVGGTSSTYGGSGPALGKWCTYVKDFIDGIAAIQPILSNNDVANCVATVKGPFGNALKGVYEAAGITTIG